MSWYQMGNSMTQRGNAEIEEQRNAERTLKWAFLYCKYRPYQYLKSLAHFTSISLTAVASQTLNILQHILLGLWCPMLN